MEQFDFSFDFKYFFFVGWIQWLLAAIGVYAATKDDKDQPEGIADFATTVNEGVIHFSEGEEKFDGKTAYYAHQFSYDGDASYENPDRGTADGDVAVDITDLVQIATTGLLATDATTEDIISKSKLTGGAGLQFDTSSSKTTGIKVNNLYYRGFTDSGISKHPKEFIDKLCQDSGLLYDLRYDDSTEKVIFKPMIQQSSPDITLATGSVTSLSRERDVSDVYSAILMTLKSPEQNYLDPVNIAQYGTGINNSGTTAQTGFTKGSYSSGASPPEYFWDTTHLRGLGPDCLSFDSSDTPFKQSEFWYHQVIWKRMTWEDTGETGNARRRFWLSGHYGVPTLNSSYDPLHLMTMWFRDGVALDIDEFSFNVRMASEINNGFTYRIEVTTGMNVSDPLSSSTSWQSFNDSSMSLKGHGSQRVTLNDCQTKGVNGLRILALRSPQAQPGWLGERRCYLRQTDVSRGYKTYGFGGAAECFNTAVGPVGHGRGRPMQNKLRQDSLFFSKDPDTFNDLDTKSEFTQAIANTDAAGGERAGYLYMGNTLNGFAVTGVGQKALFIRNTKTQATVTDVERTDYSPTYKKVANMGYKIKTFGLEDFSKAEGQQLGQQYLDDKLRRYQARDYSLDGASPFVDSNKLPKLGQTIKVADDDNFTGILTSYQFTFDAQGARFDFRLEDYNRNNTAKWIQAK